MSVLTQESTPIKNGSDTWPLPWGLSAQSESESENIDIEQLSSSEKEVLWKHLRAKHPEQAASLITLKDDEDFQALKAFFGASIVLEKQYFPEALANKRSS